MKKTFVAVVLTCSLMVSSMGMVPAEAVESNELNSIPIEVEMAMGSEPENIVVDFETLDAEVIEPAMISDKSSGSLTRATSRIEWDIPAGKIMKADTFYSLEADELVTINCTYSPRTADLDFGFMTSDDVFHFTSGSDGSIRTTIRINETGKYYFAVRNNTNRTVEVLGYVYY